MICIRVCGWHESRRVVFSSLRCRLTSGLYSWLARSVKMVSDHILHGRTCSKGYRIGHFYWILIYYTSGQWHTFMGATIIIMLVVWWVGRCTFYSSYASASFTHSIFIFLQCFAGGKLAVKVPDETSLTVYLFVGNNKSCTICNSRSRFALWTKMRRMR